MHRSVCRRVCAAVLAFPLLVPAQARPDHAPLPPRPDGLRAAAGAPTMLATERYLFVLRGDTLHQFDIETLQQLRTFRFPAATDRPGQPDTAPLSEAPEVAPGHPAKEPALAAVTAAVDAALGWLAAHQDEDGRWDTDGFMKHDDAARGEVCGGPGNAVHDVGVTGLAMLAMLSDGSTLRGGPYREHLEKAAEWLRGQQQANGLIGQNASHDFIYDHAIAAYALSEAYGLSEHQPLRHTVQRAVDYLESHRNPYAVWRYQPRDNDNDTSVTTWAVCALASAKSFGLDVNPIALQLAATYYDQVSSDDGRIGYTKAGERSSRMAGDHSQRFPVRNVETLTAAGTVGRLLLGNTVDSKPIMARSAKVLAARPPRWEPGHVDALYWCFGALATYQLGGAPWQAWRTALGTLVDHQRTDGNAAGSWDTVGVWDETDGRVGVTALYALALTTVERSLRLVR